MVVENIYTLDYIFDETTGFHKENLTSIYKDIFGEKQNFECNFYSGVLVCPFGEQLEYVHMGYSSIYENYKLIEVKNGEYIKEKELNNEEFMRLKISHYEHFKKSLEYKKLLAETVEQSKKAEQEIKKMFEEMDDDEMKGFMIPPKKMSKKERQKSAEDFLFFFLTDNIKSIELP